MEGSSSPLWEALTGNECAGAAREILRLWLDGPSRLALFQSNRAAKDLVLAHAESAQLTLCLHSCQNSLTPALLAALQARPPNTTSLTLLVNRSPHDTASSTAALHSLAAVPIESLTVENVSLGHGAILPESLLVALSLCLPQIGSLTVRAALETLPHPSSYPRLTALHIHDECVHGYDRMESLCSSVSAYLTPRITRLTLHTWDIPSPCLEQRLFTPSTAAHNLRVLEISTTLDRRLCDLLHRHAPALESLTVSFIALRAPSGDLAAGATGDAGGWRAVGGGQGGCRWKSLKCTQGMTLRSLIHVPAVQGMELDVKGSLSFDVFTEQDAADLRASLVALRARNTLLSLNVTAEVWGRPGLVMDAASELTLLSRQVLILQALHTAAHTTTDCGIRLSRWHITGACLFLLRGLPAWPRLDFYEVTWGFETVTLSAVLRVLSDQVRQLSIASLTDAQTLDGMLKRWLVEGDVSRRGQEGGEAHPLHIALTCGPEMIGRLQQALQGRGLKHVTVGLW